MCRSIRNLILLTLIMASSHGIAGVLPEPAKLSQHVYAWIGPLEGPNKENQGYRMNMVVVIGGESVAVVDTGYTADMAKEAVAHISRITNKPIRYAINSNSQPHRFMGNDVYRQMGAQIIAHKKSVQRMRKQAGNFATAIANILEIPADGVKIPALPDKVIEGQLRLDLGGLGLEIIPLGASHTPMQLGIRIEQDNIMYVGDLLYSGRLLAVLPDSRLAAWIEAFDQLKGFGNIRFIPGHGQPDKLGAFNFPTRSYLKLLLTHMDAMVEQGIDAQDAIDRLDQKAYSKLVNFDVLAGRNASWAYLLRESAAFD